MKTQRNGLFAAVLCLIALSGIGCAVSTSNEIDPDKISMAITGEYSKQSNTTEFTVQFLNSESFYSSAVELIDPASVVLDGAAMTWSNVTNYYYKNISDVSAGVTIVYTDFSGRVFSNTVTLPAEIGLPEIIPSLTKGSAYTLTWTGNAVTSGEKVTVTVKYSTGSVTASQSTAGATSVTIPASSTNSITSGTQTIYVTRSVSSALQSSPPAGGSVETAYVSKSGQITVE